jgi:hypothetical protein
MRANSYISSIMNMTAQVYKQQNKQDSNTGAVIREWAYDHTIQCKVEPISAKGASTRGDNKTFMPSDKAQGQYNENLQLKVKCLELLSKRSRIHYIRSSDGQQVYVEIDKYGDPDSIFEVTSSHAVLDPFGKVSYYETNVQRVPVQNNDKTSN